jgi:hypothetical protein
VGALRVPARQPPPPPVRRVRRWDDRAATELANNELLLQQKFETLERVEIFEGLPANRLSHRLRRGWETGGQDKESLR